MKTFTSYQDGHYFVTLKGNKRKSKNFYYRYVGYSGVEFIKRNKYAHTCPSKKEAEFLIKYLQKRIEEVGFILRT